MLQRLGKSFTATDWIVSWQDHKFDKEYRRVWRVTIATDPPRISAEE